MTRFCFPLMICFLLFPDPSEARGADPAAADAPRQVQAEIFKLDGKRLSGVLLGASDEGLLTVQTAAGSQRLGIDSLHLIRLADRSAPAARASRSFPAGLLLGGGDYLAGEISNGDADRLVLAHSLLGRIDVPIDSIRLLLPRDPSVPADFLRYPPAADEDIIYRKREGDLGEDFIKGTVDLFSREGLSFDCSLGLVDFTYDQLNAVAIAAEDEPAAGGSGSGVTVLLRERSGRLSGSLVALRSESVVLRTNCLGELTLSLDAVESLTLRHTSTVYLSDLEPSEVEESPYLGGETGFLYPYKRDRSVTGRELSCGGMRFAKGLGVHARCALSFDLNGAYSAFHSFAGLSDEVLELRARGSMVFRVLVDGTERYKSPVLRGGDEPLELPLINIKGAKILALEALYADGFDSGDRGVWGGALLIR